MSELEKTNEADGDNSQQEQTTEDSTKKSKEGEAEAFDQEKAKRLREEVENAFKSHYSLVKRFAHKDKTSRADLIGIPGLVTKYNALNDTDNSVYESYNDWLDACGNTAEVLEKED